jgi:lysophospholipase L1-like esterase
MSGSVSGSSVSLNWNASTDNTVVTGYRIYQDGVFVATSSGISYIVFGLDPLTSYDFAVSAIDAAGNESAKTATINVVTDSAGAATPAPQAMPIISRDVPAHASYENSLTIPGNANDDSYETYLTMWSADFPKWLAYDLSGVNADNRGRVLVAWYNPSGSYFEAPERVAGDYTIEVHAAAGGAGIDPPADNDAGWQILHTEIGNTFHSRQHLVDMTGYNWIRIRITDIASTFNSLEIGMDIHDASLGAEDSWLFVGDSITAGGMDNEEKGSQTYPQIINASLSAYFPAQENAGRGTWTTDDVLPHFQGWIDQFPGRYVCISFGTNDSGMNPNDFYNNYEALFNIVNAAGKIAVIPTVIWANDGRSNVNLPAFNVELERLKNNFPQIVDGPDLWSFFLNRTDLLADTLHPNAQGYVEYRRLWAEAMLNNVYGN